MRRIILACLILWSGSTASATDDEIRNRHQEFALLATKALQNLLNLEGLRQERERLHIDTSTLKAASLHEWRMLRWLTHDPETVRSPAAPYAALFPRPCESNRADCYRTLIRFERENPDAFTELSLVPLATLAMDLKRLDILLKKLRERGDLWASAAKKLALETIDYPAPDMFFFQSDKQALLSIIELQ